MARDALQPRDMGNLAPPAKALSQRMRDKLGGLEQVRPNIAAREGRRRFSAALAGDHSDPGLAGGLNQAQEGRALNGNRRDNQQIDLLGYQLSDARNLISGRR